MKHWKRLVCLLLGHPVIPTGRHGVVLREWECGRCGGIYVSHPDYDGKLLPTNSELEAIFRENRKWY
jgi:hypothetical protein